jgi:hypothetical protein
MDSVIEKPSVQSLYIDMTFNGKPLASGTAFIVTSARGPLLITARHNVTGRHQDTGQPLSKLGSIPNAIRVCHHRLNRLGEWVMGYEPLYEDEKPRWIEHPILKEKADFVALPLSQLREVQLYPYDMAAQGPDIAVGPAEVVSVVGFPFGRAAGGVFAIWVTGHIASEPAINYKGLPGFLIDCRSRPGQSGSPVIAYRSGGGFNTASGGFAISAGPTVKFLGVYSGRIAEESDLGVVWKASAIMELINSI